MPPAAIRPLTFGDVPAAAALSEAVGWNQDQTDWRRVITLHPEGALGAWRHDALVGTSTLVTYGASAAWLGMVIVAPEQRGRGLGAALVDAALAQCTALVGLDATEFGAPLYQRRGFQTVAKIERWGGVLRPAEFQGAPARLATPADLSSLAALDRRATQVDRSRLLRRLLHEDGTIVALLQSGGATRGYGVLRAGRTRGHVGPIVVSQGSDLSAIAFELAKHAAGAPIYLDAVQLPGRSAHLKNLGLDVQRTLLRMTRPSSPIMCGPQVVAAMAFEWG